MMTMKRRSFVISGLGAAGALIVGFAALPPRSRLGWAGTQAQIGDEIGLNGWIKIEPEGQVLLAMPRSEMGQGIHTAMAQLVAEEMDLELSQVRLIPAGHDTLYGNVQNVVNLGLNLHPSIAQPGAESPWARTVEWMERKVGREIGLNVTGASASVADAWEAVRLAAATARRQLLGAASLQWKLPLAELRVSAGVVSHPSGNSAHYGELAKAASATPAGDVQLKPATDWQHIGSSAPRLDLPAKVNGQARFGVDVRLPGLLFAVMRHAPTLGGSPGRVDADPVLRMPGVERIVRLSSYAGSTPGVAVVARSTWHAQRAAQALDVDWRPRLPGAIETAPVEAALKAAVRAEAEQPSAATKYQRGDARSALMNAASTVKALYQAPYLAHAAMEPLNCTAQVQGKQVTLWLPTQAPGVARECAARVAGVAVDDVTVHVTYLGGGFGRRLEADVVGQVVRVAMETGGRPVQLMWPREEDMANDFFRPAAAALMQGGIDAEGRLSALLFSSASEAIVPQWMARNLPDLARLSAPMGLPDRSADGLCDLPYEVPHQRMAHVATQHAVPVGFWRSVAHSHNSFFSESFIDELAHAAKADPVYFRLKHLASMPRHAAVLKLAAEKAGWGRVLPAGHARGVALVDGWGSVVAQVVEASAQGGKIRVHRVVCAIDCGVVVNPDIVAQQMEGGVIFGLSAALFGRIDIKAGRVQQRSFSDYPLLTLAQSPKVETHFVASDNPPRGVGEIAVPPVAPALANALFALTGQRLRSLPLTLGKG